MNAAFVSDKRDRDQNEHHDQDNALFVLREFENLEQAFHFNAAQLWYLQTSLFPLGVLQACHSEGSEESQIIFLHAFTKPIARDV